jgi:hypothetical protein
MLADPRLGLLRAKGFFRTAGGEFVTLHVIGRRSIVEVAPLWIDALDNLCVSLMMATQEATVRANFGFASPQATTFGR